jgi:transcriptional regulator with XRE-family HTH domain
MLACLDSLLYNTGMDMTGKDLESLFARNLRSRRAELGMSQVSLAERAGIPQPHVSALERGAMVPQLATIARLAEALDTTPSALISSVAFPAVSMPSAENLSATA